MTKQLVYPEMPDRTDREILNLLIKNSRLSFRTLAKKLNISVATVSHRILELERKGIIKNYTAILNHEKLGYTLSAVIEIRISRGRLIEVEKGLSKKKNVCAIYDITGDTDALIIAKFKDRADLNSFVKHLLKDRYISRTYTHLVLNTIKEDFGFL